MVADEKKREGGWTAHDRRPADHGTVIQPDSPCWANVVLFSSFSIGSTRGSKGDASGERRSHGGGAEKGAEGSRGMAGPLFASGNASEKKDGGGRRGSLRLPSSPPLPPEEDDDEEKRTWGGATCATPRTPPAAAAVIAAAVVIRFRGVGREPFSPASFHFLPSLVFAIVVVVVDNDGEEADAEKGTPSHPPSVGDAVVHSPSLPVVWSSVGRGVAVGTIVVEDNDEEEGKAVVSVCRGPSSLSSSFSSSSSSSSPSQGTYRTSNAQRAGLKINERGKS